MNNNEEFAKLFKEFDQETQKKVPKKEDKPFNSLDYCIQYLTKKGYNPYVREKNFIEICKNLRNVDFHNVNDNYYVITDDLLKRFREIVDEVKHPFKVDKKATINIFSATLDDNVETVMKEMNEKSYTHIPIYDKEEKHLVGIFSENTIFQYLLKEGIIQIDNKTKFSDIENCISLDNTKEIVKFVAKDKLYDDVVNDFIKEFKEGNKLSCVMVTHSGKPTEKVIGILTSWDIIGK